MLESHKIVDDAWLVVALMMAAMFVSAFALCSRCNKAPKIIAPNWATKVKSRCCPTHHSLPDKIKYMGYHEEHHSSRPEQQLSNEDSMIIQPSQHPVSKTIAFLHIAPTLGDLEGNLQLVMKAVRQAAMAGASWILTPELCLSGYKFAPKIGTDWIRPASEQFAIRELQKLAKELNIVLFLGHTNRILSTEGHDHSSHDNDSLLYNTLFVIERNGYIGGQHNKIQTVPQSEGWSTPGLPPPHVIVLDEGEEDTITFCLGLLICADAYPPEHAAALKEQGAQMILSAANWPPGAYGPGDSWKDRSKETGLPILVCNRTGLEASFDCRQATSVVAHQGQHIVEHSSSQSSILMVTWDFSNQALLSHYSIPV